MSEPLWTTPATRLKRQRDPRRWVARPHLLKDGWIEIEKEQGVGKAPKLTWLYEFGHRYAYRIATIHGHSSNDMELEPLTADELKSLAVALDRAMSTGVSLTPRLAGLVAKASSPPSPRPKQSR